MKRRKKGAIEEYIERRKKNEHNYMVGKMAVIAIFLTCIMYYILYVIVPQL